MHAIRTIVKLKTFLFTEQIEVSNDIEFDKIVTRKKLSVMKLAPLIDNIDANFRQGQGIIVTNIRAEFEKISMTIKEVD